MTDRLTIEENAKRYAEEMLRPYFEQLSEMQQAALHLKQAYECSVAIMDSLRPLVDQPHLQLVEAHLNRILNHCVAAGRMEEIDRHVRNEVYRKDQG